MMQHLPQLHDKNNDDDMTGPDFLFRSYFQLFVSVVFLAAGIS